LENLDYPGCDHRGGFFGQFIDVLGHGLSYPGAKYAKRIPLIMAAFILNAMLNVGWSWLFFSLHLIGWAAWEAILLEASVIVLIVLIRPISRVAAGLLVPYAAWVAFATVLTFIIWQLN